MKTCHALLCKNAVLTDEEIAFWAKFLKQFSLAEVRYAFGKWTEDKQFFPKPKEISDLCDVFRLSLANQGFPIGCHRCNWTGFYQVKQKGIEVFVADCPCRTNPSLREKQERNQGYNWDDMFWLYTRMRQIYKVGDTPDSEVLLTELDSKRPDGAPKWRRSAKDV